LTRFTGPGGLKADGSDVTFIDVEAIDAHGERCPTFEAPVKFDLAGPAQWLGGYDSGQTNTIHQTRLNLECGLNRVAVRATRTPGAIIVRADADGLKSGTITISSSGCSTVNGFASELPRLPEVVLPSNGFEPAAADTMPPAPRRTDRADRN